MNRTTLVCALGIILLFGLALGRDYIRGNQIATTNSEPAIIAEHTLPPIADGTQITTYVPHRNIYLPEMLFLVVKDIDKPAIARCKNMAFRTVDTFSRRENSNLVRADRKLDTLARIIYGECIDVSIVIYREGI